jgi:hypothetical protein
MADIKQKTELLESFYKQALAAGMAVKYHCDGVLVVSCFDDEKDEQTSLEIPAQPAP